MRAYERFLKYVSVWTTSDETSETVPSADRELVLAELLVQEWMRKDMYTDLFLQHWDVKMHLHWD